MSTKSSEKQNGVGGRFLEAFKPLNLTNEEIAKLLGVSKSRVTDYSKGVIPKKETLIKFVQITNCSLHWLITGDKPKEAPKGILQDERIRVPLDPQIRPILDNLAKISKVSIEEKANELILLSIVTASFAFDEISADQRSDLIAHLTVSSRNRKAKPNRTVQKSPKKAASKKIA